MVEWLHGVTTEDHIKLLVVRNMLWNEYRRLHEEVKAVREKKLSMWPRRQMQTSRVVGRNVGHLLVGEQRVRKKAI